MGVDAHGVAAIVKLAAGGFPLRTGRPDQLQADTFKVACRVGKIAAVEAFRRRPAWRSAMRCWIFHGCPLLADGGNQGIDVAASPDGDAGAQLDPRGESAVFNASPPVGAGHAPHALDDVGDAQQGVMAGCRFG